MGGFYSVFGWEDCREDGKLWMENGMENSVFHCLGSKGKLGRMENGMDYFPPGPTIIFLPNQEENYGEKMFSLCNYWTALSQRLQIHQQHTHIHQTHIQIHINNQSEIEKRRRRRRRKKEEDAEEDAKITIFSTQNFCFLHPKSLPLIKPNPKSSSIIKA